MSPAELAKKAKISRSYLSELENGKGEHKSPSAHLLYRIGKALGVTMSELLGKPLINAPAEEPPASLLKFARESRLPKADVEMLTTIQFRGERPKTPERWKFIYDAIKASVSMDEIRRRR